MVRASSVTLISEQQAAHGVHAGGELAGREVPCTIKSVTMAETYQALAFGREPDYVLCIAHDFEYQREKMCLFDGEKYRILRTYLAKDGSIELTIQRWDKKYDQ